MGVLPIYDFHVPILNNYVAGGIVNHNSGKSWCLGHMCFAKYLRDHAKDGEIYWCISPSMEKSISGQQAELYRSLPRSVIGGQSYDEKNGFGQIRPTLIVYPDSKRVVVRFKSAAQFQDDPRSFEQEAVSGIWIDESIEEHVYDALLPRTVAKSAFILVSAIPDVIWMHDRFAETEEGSGIKFVKLAMMDNEANLGKDALKRMIANMSEDEAQMRVFGNFRFLSGLVYKEFIPQYKPVGHKVKPFPIPDDWPRWRCLDVGMNHPTACLWVTVSPNNQLYVYREYYSRRASVIQDADAILRMSRGETFRGHTIIDPAAYQISKANMKSVAQQFSDAGLPCAMGIRVQHATGTFGLKGEVALVMDIKRLLEQHKLFVFDTCENLIREFRKWRYKTDRANQPMGNAAFVDRDNDGLDALKLLVATNPRFGGRDYKIETVAF